MKTIPIPYHTGTVPLHLEEEQLAAIITARTHGFDPKMGETDIIEQALRNPIGSRPLHELAAGKRDIVLVTSDHTRAVPSRLTLPVLLREIRRGSPDARITILIATGLHRPTTVQEQRRMFGDDIVDRENIVVNDAFCPGDFVDMGRLPSGASFCVHRLAVQCDLLVAEGFIEPHFFAGFSGGRKSILPGICSAETVNENHSFHAIASPFAQSGVLNHNPVHEDMLEAARRVNLQFIFNVALSGDKKVIAAFAGHFEKAHAAGVEFVRSLAQCPRTEGDIVVTSNGGYPLDQNLYQSVKAVSTAAMCCREGGVIIMCCGCADGMGGDNFEKLMTMGTPREIEQYLSGIPPKESIPEQWNVQVYVRALEKHTVILVSDNLPPEKVKAANMVPAQTPDEALAMARGLVGDQARVVVIPDGVAVVIA